MASNSGSEKRDKPQLVPIEGGGLDIPENPLIKINRQQSDFLRQLEELGMDVEPFISGLNQPTVTLFKLFNELGEALEKHREAEPDLAAKIERTIVLLECILQAYYLCHDLFKIAEQNSAEAEESKKQAQLEIHDEPQLLPQEKEALLKIIEVHSPHIKGLDMADPKAIDDFRAFFAQKSALARDSNVVSIEEARKK